MTKRTVTIELASGLEAPERQQKDQCQEHHGHDDT